MKNAAGEKQAGQALQATNIITNYRRSDAHTKIKAQLKTNPPYPTKYFLLSSSDFASVTTSISALTVMIGQRRHAHETWQPMRKSDGCKRIMYTSLVCVHL